MRTAEPTSPAGLSSTTAAAASRATASLDDGPAATARREASSSMACGTSHPRVRAEVGVRQQAGSAASGSAIQERCSAIPGPEISQGQQGLPLAADGAASPAVAAVLERLAGWPGARRVAVGLSGGVDSSLTAALLAAAGWQVEGLTLWLMSGKGACCAEGLVDAAAICEQLEVPHHVVDFREHFRAQIVDFLVQGYGDGITPLPCSRCNREVKFAPMLEWALRERGIHQIATGHYARVRPVGAADQPPVPGDGEGRPRLLRGVDAGKDQSYFLYDLAPELIDRLVFPLGELHKSDTRAEAARRGLRTAKKPESQDLCLADHHGSMRAFLDAHLPPRQGEIVLSDGQVLGHHDGIEHFTIGQRKGLGVAWSEPLHVVRLDAAFNRVVVAPRREAARSSCTVGAVNWLSMAPPQAPLEVAVQVRYRSAPELAQLTPLPATAADRAAGRPHRCRLEFREPQFSIAPGQAAVFYAGDVLLGGGLIQRDA